MRGGGRQVWRVETVIVGGLGTSTQSHNRQHSALRGRRIAGQAAQVLTAFGNTGSFQQLQLE
jgi:hypothetical protein